MHAIFSVMSAGIAATVSSAAVASQGPGVGAGTASPLSQLVASGIVGVMIAFCAYAVIQVLRSGSR